jgi:broad specificity phosphatase PhoE
VKRLLLVRHAHARSNAEGRINATPPGEGLSERGVGEALALRKALASEPLELGVASRLARTQETLELALGGRDVPRLVLAELDEIGVGSYEGGPFAAYRDWAWATGPQLACPGGGESRAQAADRIAGALDTLLGRPEEVVLAVSHSLPLRYVLDAADGAFPASRVEPVPHAVPHALEADGVERAVETLRAWAADPRFAERPERG